MIYVLGIDHYLQAYELQELMEKCQAIERVIKERFYNEVESIIRANRVTLLAEECRSGERTISRALAEENGCRFCEIDMPLAVRREYAIPDDYEQRPDRERAYHIREQYMFNQTIQAMSTPNESVLVLCGIGHMRAIEQLFQTAGLCTQSRDMTSEDWFDPPWKKLERGEL